MVYIFTALFAEAQNLIQKYNLRFQTSTSRIAVYEGENICLGVTGTGSVAAAVAVAAVCTQHKAGEGDFLINIGVCGSNFGNVGEMYLCNKIVEECTGRTFYPDRIYRHNLPEATVVTSARPVVAAGNHGVPDTLFDMEAAAIYQAGSYFFGPHQISFLKIVSDFAEPAAVTREAIENLLLQSEVSIKEYIDFLVMRSMEFPKNTASEGRLSQLVQDLHASVVMENSLYQLISYCKTTGIDYESAINELYDQGKLPCNSKREGKRYLEELKERLL